MLKINPVKAIPPSGTAYIKSHFAHFRVKEELIKNAFITIKTNLGFIVEYKI